MVGKTLKVKILVVEDEKVLNQIYKDKLNSSGFEVFTAFDGDEAIDMFNKNKPNLVLLDVMIPKKNGYEVLEEIRESEEGKDTPVIMVSNLSQDEDIKKAKDLGVNDFLLKSNIKISDMMDKIKDVLSKSL